MEIIGEAIECYQNAPYSMDANEATITGLLYFRRIIATAMVRLSDDITDFRRDKDRAEWMYKMAVNEKFKGFRTEGLAQEASKKRAESASQKEKQEWIDAECRFEQARMVWNAARENLNALAGDVAFLKEEYSRINYTQQK